jgi:hypothetical protein
MPFSGVKRRGLPIRDWSTQLLLLIIDKTKNPILHFDFPYPLPCTRYIAIANTLSLTNHRESRISTHGFQHSLCVNNARATPVMVFRSACLGPDLFEVAPEVKKKL